MVWLPWKPRGDEEAGLKLATAATRPGARAAPAGAVVGWRDAPGQGGERGTPATEDQLRAVAACGGAWRRRACTDGAAWSRRRSGATGARAAGSGTRAIWRARMPSARPSAGAASTRVFESLDMAAVVREWERGDELMWSFIISPEDAERIDLRQHVRDLVAGMERDLGTRLEWVAIDHHNTDDAHVHLLIRGVRDDGRSAHARPRLCAPRHPRTEPGTDRARAGAATGAGGFARARTDHRTRAMDRDRPRA